MRLATDASPYGVGAVLMHVTPDGLERPVAFASYALSRGEQNYSQLDREALGIIFGVKKFHTYLFGGRFTLITDHKPLTSIVSPTKVTPSMAAARLQPFPSFWPPTTTTSSTGCLPTTPVRTQCHAYLWPRETPTRSSRKKRSSTRLSSPALPVTAIQLGIATQHDPILAQVHCWTRSGWPATLPNEMFQPYKA